MFVAHLPFFCDSEESEEETTVMEAGLATFLGVLRGGKRGAEHAFLADRILVFSRRRGSGGGRT
jgi:hypothetical protein